ncbi:MAG TPA: ABC transporter ATP-binding protein, partial [Acidimicrobiia bacterium]|nr:ABC transporter ATP-binding protein [Acidimicrobiia bacterium]
MRYGSNDVLNGVDFDVHRGEVVTLLGPNGAGKTTTIEILEGFRIASDGQIRVLGVDPSRGDEQWRARVGVVLQSWRDHARWTPRDLLAHLGRYYVPHSTPERIRPYDIEELISMVGIEEQAEQKIRTLSGGQRRRIELARILFAAAETMILDEHTNHLDADSVVWLREFVKNYRGG